MRTAYSVGHSNREPDELLDLLREAGIATLADVRRVPASRRHPWFARAALDAALAGAGIRYRWLGEGLGGRRAPMRPVEASPNAALREEAFRAYADAFDEPHFQRELGILEQLAADAPTAMLCAERDWRRCHRQLLSDVLVARGREVIHLVGPGRRETHQLHEWARVSDGRVTYPALL